MFLWKIIGKLSLNTHYHAFIPHVLKCVLSGYCFVQHFFYAEKFWKTLVHLRALIYTVYAHYFGTVKLLDGLSHYYINKGVQMCEYFWLIAEHKSICCTKPTTSFTSKPVLPYFQ